jgi:acetylornithine deacetylase/succinyl-diaminopimelate desuccinylase-like protein
VTGSGRTGQDAAGSPSVTTTVDERLDALYAIGGGPGANRIGYSAAEDEAHLLAAAWMRDAGLQVEVDADGNLVGRLAGREPGLPEVWSGSHLDSVPQGGRFDGPLGVVAALEAVRRLGRQRRTLAVVAFRDEERGCAGSRGLVRRGDPLPGAFLELHHEQGPRLALLGAPLAVVTGIVGYTRAERVVDGRAGHAGTTPMETRDDALVRAAAEILRVRDVAVSIPGAVATVGRIEAEPGSGNVVPGRVRFTVDARAPDADRLARLLDGLGIDPAGAVPPTEFSGVAVDALRAAIQARGLPRVELASGAGHDAGVLARAGVPAAMLFVRAGNDGVSHSPDEDAAPEDVALALDVLADALERLASAS